MMESLFDYRNPLYGRRTGQWKVGQLNFFDIKDFFPNYRMEELVNTYACTSGIPQYLLMFNPDISVKENIKRTFLNRGNVLYEDAERILKDELREPIIYLNIMGCINEGATTLSEISKKTRVNITNLPKYLNVLTSMGLIRKEFPVTVVERKARRGIYKIMDNYFRFWLRFIYQFKDEIEIGSYSIESFEKEYNTYLGSTFEDVAKQFLIRLNQKGKSPFNFTKIGRWWYKDKEIDIVALNENSKEMAFIECKWSNLKKEDCKRILEELKEKSKSVQWFNESRKDYFGLFAKKIEDKERIRENGFLAYDLRDF
jgi:hypothetical protein